MTPLPPTNKGRKFPAEPLTPDEVELIVAQLSTRYPAGLRFRALIGVLYGAGLRLAEALALMPRDVDTRARTVHVRHGKNDDSRLAGLAKTDAERLAHWLDKRKELGLTGRHPIFATYETGKVGKPLDQRYVRNRLAELAVRAGIEKRVHPHGLRHSHAFAMAQDGVPMHVIQRQLGHRSLTVTGIYVGHLMPAEVIRIVSEHDGGRGRPHADAATATGTAHDARGHA